MPGSAWRRTSSVAGTRATQTPAYLIGAKTIPFRELAQARIAADQVIDGKVPDPTGGATHYYAIAMKKAPSWGAKAKETLRLGGHVFFNDVP